MDELGIRDLAICVAGDPTPQELVQHLTAFTFEACNPESVCLYLRGYGQQEQQLTLLAHRGLTAAEVERYGVIDIGFPIPASDAVRRRQPYSRSFTELAEDFPLLHVRPELLSHGSMLIVPIQDSAITRALLFVALPGDIDWNASSWQNVLALQAALSLYVRANLAFWDEVQTPSTGASLSRKLTDRQCAILALVEAGKSSSSIAARLGFSESTVKKDLRRAMAIVGATSRRQAVTKARDLGLLPVA